MPSAGAGRVNGLGNAAFTKRGRSLSTAAAALNPLIYALASALAHAGFAPALQMGDAAMKRGSLAAWLRKFLDAMAIAAPACRLTLGSMPAHLCEPNSVNRTPQTRGIAAERIVLCFRLQTNRACSSNTTRAQHGQHGQCACSDGGSRWRHAAAWLRQVPLLSWRLHALPQP